ncbi:MAG: hypothetical protein HRS50_02490 [Mycoplasmataceae bacterium]|nr:hypothetical protein [Mycoplasmataceae bacterium]
MILKLIEIKKPLIGSEKYIMFSEIKDNILTKDKIFKILNKDNLNTYTKISLLEEKSKEFIKWETIPRKNIVDKDSEKCILIRKFYLNPNNSFYNEECCDSAKKIYNKKKISILDSFTKKESIAELKGKESWNSLKEVLNIDDHEMEENWIYIYSLIRELLFSPFECLSTKETFLCIIRNVYDNEVKLENMDEFLLEKWNVNALLQDLTNIYLRPLCKKNNISIKKINSQGKLKIIPEKNMVSELCKRGVINKWLNFAISFLIGEMGFNQKNDQSHNGDRKLYQNEMFMSILIMSDLKKILNDK